MSDVNAATSTPTFGISLGATASMCVDSTGEIFRNELGGHTTATCVAFTSEGRQLGEAAVAGFTANAKQTATWCLSVAFSLKRRDLFVDDSGGTAVCDSRK